MLLSSSPPPSCFSHPTIHPLVWTSVAFSFDTATQITRACGNKRKLLPSTHACCPPMAASSSSVPAKAGKQHFAHTSDVKQSQQQETSVKMELAELNMHSRPRRLTCSRASMRFPPCAQLGAHAWGWCAAVLIGSRWGCLNVVAQGAGCDAIAHTASCQAGSTWQRRCTLHGCWRKGRRQQECPCWRRCVHDADCCSNGCCCCCPPGWRGALRLPLPVGVAGCRWQNCCSYCPCCSCSCCCWK